MICQKGSRERELTRSEKCRPGRELSAVDTDMGNVGIKACKANLSTFATDFPTYCQIRTDSLRNATRIVALAHGTQTLSGIHLSIGPYALSLRGAIPLKYLS